MSDFETLAVSVDEHVGRIRLNRPESLNPLSTTCLEELIAAAAERGADRPALTVITPVSIDHQQYLGETLGEIAFEKAGILKRGVPCIVGPQPEAALAVIDRRAAEVSSITSFSLRWPASSSFFRYSCRGFARRLKSWRNFP